MSVKNLEENFQTGLAQDLVIALYNYFIFRTLGENHKLVNGLQDEVEKKSLVYIQTSSCDLAILSLAKVLDKNKQSHSLWSILEECASTHSDHFPLQLNVDYLPEDLKPYPALKQIEAFTSTKLPGSTLKDSQQLIEYLYEVLNQPTVNQAIQNVRTARNKGVAHNDKDVQAIQTFWDDFAFILTLGRLMLSVLSELYINTHFETFIDTNPNSVNLQILTNGSWLYEKLDRLFGQKKVVNWIE